MKNNHAMHMAARLAFITSLTLLLVKFGAYFLTDSKAVLSDAIESAVNRWMKTTPMATARLNHFQLDLKAASLLLQLL